VLTADDPANDNTESPTAPPAGNPRAHYLDRWHLQRDGPAALGITALVLPVRRIDGTLAALKLQPVNEENAAEAVGLRAWAGHGAVHLIDDDPATGALLFERLDASSPLSALPDDTEALHELAELLGRLVAIPARTGLRRLPTSHKP
jgi:streptomycin 6-kinase